MNEFRGQIRSMTKQIRGAGYLVSFEMDGIPEGMEGKDLDITVKEHKEHRSKDANALLWACLGEIAAALHSDKWEIYLMMLKRYGRFTYIAVRPHAVEAVKKQWRECEVVGNTYTNGEQTVQLLCYFGSSTYTTKEMSKLLDGVISEMEEMGLNRPTSAEMKRAIAEWERKYGNTKSEKICNTAKTESTEV